MEYGTTHIMLVGQEMEDKIMCAAVNCDMYSPITATKMLRVSVKCIKVKRGKQL